MRTPKHLRMILASIICLVSLASGAQKLSANQTMQMELQARKTAIEAYHSLTQFVITQDSTNWVQGLKDLKNCQNIFSNLIRNGSSVMAMTASMQADGYKLDVSGLETEMKLYSYDYFYSKIKRETASQRDKKVKYNGDSYTVSKYGEEEFDLLAKKIKNTEKMVKDVEATLNTYKKNGVK